MFRSKQKVVCVANHWKFRDRAKWTMWDKLCNFMTGRIPPGFGPKNGDVCTVTMSINHPEFGPMTAVDEWPGQLYSSASFRVIDELEAQLECLEKEGAPEVHELQTIQP